MTEEFKFRFRRGSHGLAANLRAGTHPLREAPAQGIQIYRNIWLALPEPGLHWKDTAWLAFGVSLNAPTLSRLQPEGSLIRVAALDYPLSDYRAEVAALAMDGWLRARFAIETPGASVDYDAIQDQYTFTWGDVTDPFSDAPMR
ncbi:hypothetical protein GCM10010387_02940 [Streptomyces inusitatus]|uniref:Uncharacterized protein n=1 Tax=Streptomyces inusitatus TaxID=68221 RepID=A0A918PKM5_9ACTN|nr:hypothetical protein [Streptomyces inusitatus]GGZ14261.1 hypothetical protein GCM10010387_02940 [Streptomyces inusitatus]